MGIGGWHYGRSVILVACWSRFPPQNVFHFAAVFIAVYFYDFCAYKIFQHESLNISNARLFL